MYWAPNPLPEWRFNTEVNWNRLPRDGRFVLTTCWGHPCRFHRCMGYWGRRSRPWRGPGLRLAMWPPPGRHTNQPLGITHHTISSAIITLRFSGVHIEFQRGGRVWMKPHGSERSSWGLPQESLWSFGVICWFLKHFTLFLAFKNLFIWNSTKYCMQLVGLRPKGFIVLFYT